MNDPYTNDAGSTVKRVRPVGARLLVVLVLFVVLVLTFGALMLAAGPAGAATKTVSITDSSFDPPTLEVEPGDTVIWTNDGTATHDVSADDGTFQSGPLAPGQTFPFTFQTQGTYVYRSTTDSNLTGSITVGGAAIGSAQSVSPFVATENAPTTPDQAVTSPETFASTGAAESIALAVLGTVALLFGWAVLTGFGSPFGRLEPWRILALGDPRRLGFSDELMPRGRWRRTPRRSRQADLLPGRSLGSRLPPTAPVTAPPSTRTARRRGAH
ncbi:MAG: cupredoxin domain-containing protein [Acidimicrobiia bacterium]